MSLDEERQGSAVVVRLRGSCKVGASALELKDTLDRIAREESGAVVLDLSQLKMFDSTALGVVAGAGRSFHAAGRELYLAGPNERVALLFKLTHLDEIFPVVPAVSAALGKPH